MAIIKYCVASSNGWLVLLILALYYLLHIPFAPYMSPPGPPNHVLCTEEFCNQNINFFSETIIHVGVRV